jgi:hypothetical protein
MLVFLTTLLHLNHGTPFLCFGLEQQASYSSESAVVPEHSIWRDSRGEAEISASSDAMFAIIVCILMKLTAAHEPLGDVGRL